MELKLLIEELLTNAQFLVDASGNKTAVQIDYTAWEELLTVLEDLEDAEEIIRGRASGEMAIPLEQARSGFQTDDRPLRPFGLCAGEFTVPDDFDHPLPEEILKEFEGRI